MLCYRDAGMSEGICAQASLDRRRLEEAHLKYCILQMYQRYPKNFPKWSIASTLKQTFKSVTPTFYQAFSANFAGTYMCDLIRNMWFRFHLASPKTMPMGMWFNNKYCSTLDSVLSFTASQSTIVNVITPFT